MNKEGIIDLCPQSILCRTIHQYPTITASDKELSIVALTSKSPITLMDYRRIFSVISCVLEEHAELHKACNLFAMIGAHLLREHYRLPAQAVSGAAVFQLSPTLKTMVFAKVVDGRLCSGLDGFHSWIECKGYAIDFLAPLFPECFAGLEPHQEVPRRAFVKNLSLMASHVPEAGDPGGMFVLKADELCQANMIKTFNERPQPGDLQTICSTWYRRPPKKMNVELAIRDNTGKITTLRRRDIGIRGFW